MSCGRVWGRVGGGIRGLYRSSAVRVLEAREPSLGYAMVLPASGPEARTVLNGFWSVRTWLRAQRRLLNSGGRVFAAREPNWVCRKTPPGPRKTKGPGLGRPRTSHVFSFSFGAAHATALYLHRCFRRRQLQGAGLQSSTPKSSIVGRFLAKLGPENRPNNFASKNYCRLLNDASGPRAGLPGPVLGRFGPGGASHPAKPPRTPGSVARPSLIHSPSLLRRFVGLGRGVGRRPPM